MTAPHYARMKTAFADGDYEFQLGVPQLQEFEKKFDKSAYATFRSMADGDYRVVDIVEIIRLGLIGAGTLPNEALRLVRDYVEKYPPSVNMPLALSILDRAYFGDKAEAA